MVSQAWCQEEGVKTKTWVVGIIITIFFRTVEIISDLIFGLIHMKKKKITLPPIDNVLLLESASSLAKKIRSQKVISFCVNIIEPELMLQSIIRLQVKK